MAHFYFLLDMSVSVLSVLFKGGTVPPYSSNAPPKIHNVPPFIDGDQMVKPSLTGNYNGNYSV